MHGKYIHQMGVEVQLRVFFGRVEEEWDLNEIRRGHSPHQQQFISGARQWEHYALHFLCHMNYFINKRTLKSARTWGFGEISVPSHNGLWTKAEGSVDHILGGCREALGTLPFF